MKGCCIKNIATFLWMFWKAFNGKTHTVYNLFDHWNMALSTDSRHLKTLLATRSVFHLFWRWQPVAHAPFQHPRNAAVLKRSRPRTSDTAIWTSLIVAWCIKTIGSWGIEVSEFDHLIHVKTFNEQPSAVFTFDNLPIIYWGYVKIPFMFSVSRKYMYI